MDVGTESYTEKQKGQASDSFKRACTVLGIGRELYSAGFIWIPADKTNIQKRGDKFYTYDKLSIHKIAYNEEGEISGLVIVNQSGTAVYTLEDRDSRKSEVQNQADEKVETINKELARTGVALDAVLKRYGVSSIQDMSADVYARALTSLKRTKNRTQPA